MAEWARAKIMIVGEGRAGKTAFANSLTGKMFVQTDSTIGISTFSCDVRCTSIDDNSHWDGDFKEPFKLLEGTLATQIKKGKLLSKPNISGAATSSTPFIGYFQSLISDNLNASQGTFPVQNLYFIAIYFIFFWHD